MVDPGNQVRLDDNILIGGLSPAGEESYEVGLFLLPSGADEKGEFWPAVVEVNRNVITRYQKGVAIDFHCEGGPPEALMLSGQDNVIEQNGQDLCPADYPWPPGFKK